MLYLIFGLTDMFSLWERIHNCNPGWKREKSSESSCLHNNISHHFQFHLILGVNPNRSDFKNSISSICTNCYFNFSHLSTLFSLINCSWYTFVHLMIVCVILIMQSWIFTYTWLLNKPYGNRVTLREQNRS